MPWEWAVTSVAREHEAISKLAVGLGLHSWGHTFTQTALPILFRRGRGGERFGADGSGSRSSLKPPYPAEGSNCEPGSLNRLLRVPI